MSRPLLFGFVLALATTQPAQAEVFDSGTINEVKTVFIDRSMSPAGHKFVKFFTTYWYVNFPQTKAVISFTEVPGSRQGARLLIEYDNEILTQVPINSRDPNPAPRAESMASAIQRQVVQKLLGQALGQHPDLAKDEL